MPIFGNISKSKGKWIGGQEILMMMTVDMSIQSRQDKWDSGISFEYLKQRSYHIFVSIFNKVAKILNFIHNRIGEARILKK